MLLTTVVGQPDVYQVTVDATSQDPVSCDKCLAGTWDIDHQSFAEYLSAPFKEIPGFLEMGNTVGVWRYVFTPTGRLTGEFSYAVSYALTSEGGFGDIVTEVVVTIKGEGRALYFNPSAGVLGTQLIDSDVVMEQFATINGQEVDAGLGPSFNPMLSTMGTTYECTPTLLTIQPPGTEEAGIPPIDYVRVK